MIVITLSGHILASLTTIFLELWAINSGRAPSSLAMATAILIMRKRMFYIGLIILGLFILLPLFVEHSIWDMGHLFAAFFGFISARLLLKLSPVRTVSSPYELLLKCRSELSNK